MTLSPSQILKADYEKLWFWQKWLLPKALKEALSENSLSSERIYRAYVKNSWFFHPWLFSCIRNFANAVAPVVLYRQQEDAFCIKALETASEAGLFKRYPPSRELSRSVFVQGLTTLHRAGLLTGERAQAYFNALAQHQDPHWLARGITTLHQAGLLAGERAQDNFNALAQHQDFHWLGGIITLHQAGLLADERAQDNFNALAQNKNPHWLARGITTLHQAGLLADERTQDNFNVLAQHRHSHLLAKGVTILHQAGLLADERAQDNFNALVQHRILDGFIAELEILHEANLLIQDNFNALVQHPGLFYPGINIFCESGLLTQAHFEAAIRHAPILFANETDRFWYRIPRLTAAHWQAILQLCERHEGHPAAGQVAFRDYVNQQILREDQQILERARVNPEGLINGGQSVHALSIHESVSASVSLLRATYQEQMRGAVNSLVEQLKKECLALTWKDYLVSKHLTAEEQQDTHPKYQQAQLEFQAAQRCWTHLDSHFYLSFKDGRSQTTIQELLALIQLALHDDLKRTKGTTVKDGLCALICALYQIQRGYNINALDVDDKRSEDLFICVAGTFNKLTAALESIHPDVNLRYEVLQAATARFPILVKERLIAHIKSIGDEKTRQALIDHLAQEKGYEISTWQAIAPQVEQGLREEFSSLYSSNVRDMATLLATGEYYAIKKEDLTKAGLLPTKPPVAPNPQGFFAPRPEQELDATQPQQGPVS